MALHKEPTLLQSLLEHDWDVVTQESNSGKVQALLKLLDTWLSSGERVVVFVHERRILDILQVGCLQLQLAQPHPSALPPPLLLYPPHSLCSALAA